jgi:serine-type D-Ala-D-Ala carboxypeptidase/endopeptidase
MIARRKLALGILALALPGRAGAETTQQQITQWLGDRPGGVVGAVVGKNQTAFAAAGKFAADNATPVGADTFFEIGSVTKAFTGVLLADAVRAGKVALEDNVGAPFEPSQVTFRQLATHTSGLPRLPADAFSWKQLWFDPNPYATQTLERLVASHRASQPSGVGEVSYSNLGFSILGQAIAAAWGLGYEDVLTDRILKPAGLNETRLSWRAVESARLAPPHVGTRRGMNWDLNAYAPCGALVSTPRELAKWIGLCLQPDTTPLGRALADSFVPQKPWPAARGRIALGWVVSRLGRHRMIWHNGATGGYGSFVGFLPDVGVGVVVLTNHNASVDELGVQLLETAATAAGSAREESPGSGEKR